MTTLAARSWPFGAHAQRRALPGLSITLGFTITYLSLIVLIPLAALLLLDSETDIPPAGAAALSVTVPVADVPPVTLVGLTETDERAVAAVIASDVVVLVPL